MDWYFRQWAQHGCDGKFWIRDYLGIVVFRSHFFWRVFKMDQHHISNLILKLENDVWPNIIEILLIILVRDQVTVMDENGVKVKKTKDGKKFIHHNGSTFKLKCEGTKSTLYWCTLNRRNVSDCSAKLRVCKATGVQEMIGTYSQTCNHRNTSSLVSSSALVDITNLQSPSKKKSWITPMICERK